MIRRPTLFTAIALTGLLAAPVVVAGEADVTAVATREAGGTYTFNVTVRHGDEGWEHYADAWDVVAMDGTVIATRTLFHPHVNEQPFTRSLAGVRVPDGTVEVRIRARDKVHGHGGQELIVNLRTGETRTATGEQS